jgi:AraC-like DNA-binding protein
MPAKTKPVTFKKKAFLTNTNLSVSHPAAQTLKTYHNHEFGELIFILGGEGIQITQEEETLLERGDVFVMEGEQAHGFKKLSDLNVFYVIFDLDFFNTLRKEFEGLKGFNVLFGLEPQLRKNYNFKSTLKLNDKQLEEISVLLSLYEKECKYNLPWKESVVKNHFKNIVVHLCRCYIQSTVSSKDLLLKLEKTVNYMKKNFAKDISLEKLAKTAKMNISTFRRMFKEVTGYSPITFLQQLRIAEATRLFLTTNLKVKNVSIKVGYNNQMYFVKIFKKTMGITPKEYLKSTHKISKKKKTKAKK